MGPVIGRRAQFSATKECTGFLRTNNALLQFFVVKACVLIFRSQIILKELCFMLEKEVFCPPSFSLKCSQARLKKSWVSKTGLSQSL